MPEVTPEAVTMQKMPIFLKTHPITSFASRLQSQLDPKYEVQSLTHEEVSYTPKGLLEFSKVYKQKTRLTCMGVDTKVWDNSGSI